MTTNRVHIFLSGAASSASLCGRAYGLGCPGSTRRTINGCTLSALPRQSRAGYHAREDGVRAQRARRRGGAWAAYWPKREPLESVDELELVTRVMCSPGLEVELDLAAPLPVARSVGNDDLDHVRLDHVGNAAPAVEIVP